ncbi:MAG TPA: bacillithiol biosynthesis deacetylase BshB1 [Oligoflexia bacterium]|nr:bacillithiol biosynthesis deacetylase BshB1 [Oligoflexia bacterium]HMP48973.1 bacillithiol biosynthesis deacetylase BshB1 [Oligoflexia bacterium]
MNASYDLNLVELNIPSLDVLAFAPHPDDVELFCGGTILSLTDKGYKVGIIDLTQGEASSRGTLKERKEETSNASSILNINFRQNLRIPDLSINQEGKISLAEQIKRVTYCIRKAKPDLLLSPYGEERHPDHQGARLLIEKSIFSAHVSSQYPELPPPCNIPMVLWYMCRKEFRPDLIVDISKFKKNKMAAINSYISQVSRSDSQNEPKTLVSDPLSLHSLEARDAYYGSQIGVSYGEAFYAGGPLPVPDPLAFVRSIGSLKRFLTTGN